MHLAKRELDKAKRGAGTNASRDVRVYNADQSYSGALDKQSLISTGNGAGLGSQVGKTVVKKMTNNQVQNIKSFIDDL